MKTTGDSIIFETIEEVDDLWLMMIEYIVRVKSSHVDDEIQRHIEIAEYLKKELGSMYLN